MIILNTQATKTRATPHRTAMARPLRLLQPVRHFFVRLREASGEL